MKTIQFFTIVLLACACSLNSIAQENAKTKFNFSSTRKINVGVLVYDGVEIIDTGGPIDVFIKANNWNGNYNIYTVSATKNKSIVMDGKTVVLNSKYTIYNAPQADILIIPGT